MADRPNNATDALARMIAMRGMDYPYILGTGNRTHGIPRGPWDCAGAAICEAFEVTRHRPGYARGALPPAWSRFADVIDDINTNSVIKDALLNQDLFRFVPDGELLEGGDLLAYPTIIIHDSSGEVHRFVGHVQMALTPNGARAGGPYSGVRVLHACGGDGRRPAVIESSAKVMDRHNEIWPKLAHRAWALRVVQR